MSCRGNHTQPVQSEPSFPVPGPPVPVGKGHHLHSRLSFAVDNCKWEVLQDELPRCVLTGWPTLR